MKQIKKVIRDKEKASRRNQSQNNLTLNLLYSDITIQ